MRWQNRLETPASFAVFVEYDALDKSTGNSFEVRIGDQAFVGEVSPGVVSKRVHLGRATLPQGRNDIIVKAKHLESKELFRLRSVTLEPVPEPSER